MIVVVRIPDWVLEEDLAVVRVGDRFDDWLTFTERDRYAAPAEQLQPLHAEARPIPPWLGADLHHRARRCLIQRRAAFGYDKKILPVHGSLGEVTSREFGHVRIKSGCPLWVAS